MLIVAFVREVPEKLLGCGPRRQKKKLDDIPCLFITRVLASVTFNIVLGGEGGLGQRRDRNLASGPTVHLVVVLGEGLPTLGEGGVKNCPGLGWLCTCKQPSNCFMRRGTEGEPSQEWRSISGHKKFTT